MILPGSNTAVLMWPEFPIEFRNPTQILKLEEGGM